MTLWILALGFFPEDWLTSRALTASENKSSFEWISAGCTEAGSSEGHRAQCSEHPLGAAGPALGPPVLSEMHPAPPPSRLLCCRLSTLSGAWHEDPCRPQCPHLQNGNNNSFFTGLWDERVL